MNSLEGQSIFLSASFPSGERALRFEPFDPGAIADAVTAVVRAVLVRTGRLLFGGHPTITPLVLMVANELGTKDSVDIFQSEWFEDQITQETRTLAEAGYGSISWTPKLPTWEESLQAMREEMLGGDRTPIAGVFVGGMEGIVDEYRLFLRCQPGVPCISLVGPGGAAATLPLDDTRAILGRHVTSRHYPFVASAIADRLAAVGRTGAR